MKNWKGTTGEWQHGEDFDNLHEITLCDAANNIVNVKDLSVTHKPTREEILANVTLIVDAGNTVNKCDLMPSQLLGQRDLLLAQLKSVLAHKSITEWLTDSRPEHDEDAKTLSRMFSSIDHLIKQIEG